MDNSGGRKDPKVVELITVSEDRNQTVRKKVASSRISEMYVAYTLSMNNYNNKKISIKAN